MSDEKAPKKPWGPGEWFINGFLVSLFAAVPWAIGDGGGPEALFYVASVMVGIGSLMILVAVIAKGVQVGNSSTRWE